MKKNLPEGIRRLSIFAGGVCCIAFAAWVAAEVQDVGFDGMRWFNVLGGFVVAYVGGWSMVRAVGWVYRGFNADKNSTP